MDLSFKKFIKYLIVVMALESQAQEVPVSAVREPGQNWQQALQNQRKHLHDNRVRVQVDYFLEDASALDVMALPDWSQGEEALNSLVERSRYVRRYNNPNEADFLRQAAWLYPVDGCYAKAAHVSAEAVKRGHVRPGKVFAYGDLEFKTPYAKNRRTTYWSYHVAAGYRIGTAVYVLDPMVNGREAISLNQWLSQISKNPQKVKVKLCDGGAYSPYSKCRGSKSNGAYLGHMRGVLLEEWSHLIKLGYKPAELLGP